MNIIISGNLTGFSRFYATPNANNLYSEAKFDFDYRNFLAFLNNEEKVYAISFSSRVVSVSLITRILDSFRRPGILVVSALFERGQVVESIMNPQNKNALYQLLNEINDKFYEKNFLNGMLNQNAAVLMQDYYRDILSKYQLSSRIGQRNLNINGHIDVTTPNKQIGYVAAKESDISLYLSSPYRRSYEGYHHVFFAYNAPQNIEETPEEVIMYRVYIANNNLSLPGLVKLTDRIYRLAPNRGEIDFNQEYTYKDVIEGKAGNKIQTSIEGETLKLTYRFEEEEKIITFVFREKGNELSFANIAPVNIEYANGNSLPLSSERFTFRGKEIYEQMTLNSSKYIIINQRIDISRMQNEAECYIEVEKGDSVLLPFNDNIHKKITLIRRNTGQEKVYEIVGNLNIIIPGNRDEWDYTIETEHYETIKGCLGDNRIPGFTRKRTNNGPTPKPQGKTTVTNEEPESKKSYIEELLLKNIHYVAIVVFLLVYVGLSWSFHWWPWDKETKQEETEFVAEEKEVTKEVIIKYLDSNGDNLKDDDVYTDKIETSPIIKLEIEESNVIEKKDISEDKYQFTALDNCEEEVRFTVKFDNITLCDYGVPFNQLEGNIDLTLNVPIDAILLYKDLFNKESYKPNEWKLVQEKYNNVKETLNSNDSFKESLKFLYENREKKINEHSQQTTTTSQESRQEQAIKKVSSSKIPKERLQLETLSKLDCTLDEIDAIEKILINEKRLNDKLKDGTTAKQRIKALKNTIAILQKGYKGSWLPSTNDLSKEQSSFIDSYRNKISAINKQGKNGAFKNVNSMNEFKTILIKELGINFDK